MTSITFTCSSRLHVLWAVLLLGIVLPHNSDAFATATTTRGHGAVPMPASASTTSTTNTQLHFQDDSSSSSSSSSATTTTLLPRHNKNNAISSIAERRRREWIDRSIDYYSKVMREERRRTNNNLGLLADDDDRHETTLPTSYYYPPDYVVLAKKHYFALRKIKDGKPNQAESIYRRIIAEIQQHDDGEPCDHAQLAVTTLLLALHLQRTGAPCQGVRSVFLNFVRVAIVRDGEDACACSAKVLQAFALFEMKRGNRLKSLALVKKAVQLDPTLRPVLKWKQFRDARARVVVQSNRNDHNSSNDSSSSKSP